MTCLNCKYYLSPTRDRMFCGLGISPRDAQAENFCSYKEEGKPDKIELKQVSIWDYDTDKRLEQCSNSIKNLCNNLNIKIYKFKRTHTYVNKTERKVEINIWFSNIYWHMLKDIFPKNCEIYQDYKSGYKILTVTYKENKRQAFIKKKTKKGKTVV